MKKNLLVVLCALCLLSIRAYSADWKPVEGRIMTDWANQVDPKNPLPEYPRPAMVREQWQNLNGLWEYAIVNKDAKKLDFWDGEILVPFAVESALSGVGKTVGTDKALWYRRHFSIPSQWQHQRMLLHFGAVDWESTIWVNGKQVGHHKGGFDPFTLDITDALKKDATQEIIVRVWDPTDANNSGIPRGKQVTEPEGIWYTPVTGIWQTVWLEPVAKTYIKSIKVTPDLDNAQVKVQYEIEGIDSQEDDYFLWIGALDEAKVVDNHLCHPGEPVTLTLDNVKEWTPETPFLYDLSLKLTRDGHILDDIDSYFGMRKIEIKKDNEGINRLFLNNKPVFQFGPLDQGWWPDGLYTAPTDEALRYDVEMTKAWGFNMLRKHVKTEPQRLYYWCDKLGMLVWQDMPSSNPARNRHSAEALKSMDAQWEIEWKAIMDALYHHPSIVMWVPFNEGWGQYDTVRITNWTKEYDPSRLVNNASGWTDKGAGNVHDVHKYPNPGMPPLEEKRAAVLGEYGGLGLPVKGHLWEAGGNWGYQTYDQTKVLEDRYIELTQALYKLVDRGLAAAVYTQTTDVEVEVNGLMTYDRKVIKLDPKKFAPINQGYLPPFFKNDLTLFSESVDVELIGKHSPKIRYTLDGTEPTESSALYTKPIAIDKPCTLKARCFWDNGMASTSISRQYSKADKVSKAVDVDVQNAGLKVDIYRGEWNTLPDFSTIQAADSKVAKKVDLAHAPADQFVGLRFTGFINVPATGIYQFWLASDDGSKMLLDGKTLIDNDGLHGMSAVNGQVALEAGWHPIEIQYFQNAGGLELELLWEGTGFIKTQVGAEVLGH